MWCEVEFSIDSQTTMFDVVVAMDVVVLVVTRMMMKMMMMMMMTMTMMMMIEKVWSCRGLLLILLNHLSI